MVKKIITYTDAGGSGGYPVHAYVIPKYIHSFYRVGDRVWYTYTSPANRTEQGDKERVGWEAGTVMGLGPLSSRYSPNHKCIWDSEGSRCYFIKFDKGSAMYNASENMLVPIDKLLE